MNTNASNTNNVTNQQEQRQQYWKERNELLDYRYEETKMWQQGVSEGIEELIVEQKVTNDLLRKLLQSKQNSRVTEGEAVAATEIAKRKESDTDDFEA